MSIRSIMSGASGITEAGVLQFITDLLKISGVLDITGTQLLVTAGSGLHVNVAVGRAYLLASGGNGYPIINDSTYNLTINSNASGNPRITSVVLYKNISGTPNTDDTNTNFIIGVDGATASSPSAPSSSTIQAAVGAGNPWVLLANVRVNSGASSLSGYVTDMRSQTKWRNDLLNDDQWVPVNATGGTTTLDLSLGRNFQVNLQTSATTLALLNVPMNCKRIVIRLTQANGGNSTVTWWSGLSFPDTITPTLTPTNAKSDEIVINFLTVVSDSVNTSEGFVVGQNI